MLLIHCCVVKPTVILYTILVHVVQVVTVLLGVVPVNYNYSDVLKINVQADELVFALLEVLIVKLDSILSLVQM